MLRFKKKLGGGVRSGGGRGECVQRIEVIVKMKKGGFRSGVWSGHGGCVQKIEDIVKMQKKVGGVRSGVPGRGCPVVGGPVGGGDGLGSGWMCAKN